MKRYVLHNIKTDKIEKDTCNEKEFINTLEKLSSFKNYEVYAIYPDYKTYETIKKIVTITVTTNQKGQNKCGLSTN